VVVELAFLCGFSGFFCFFFCYERSTGGTGAGRAVGVVWWLSVWGGGSVVKAVMYVGEILAGSVCAQNASRSEEARPWR
jgi:hypothetical protein